MAIIDAFNSRSSDIMRYLIAFCWFTSPKKVSETIAEVDLISNSKSR